MIRSYYRVNYLLKDNKKRLPTMCIVHSTLRDATTPYTGRWCAYKKAFIVNNSKTS